MKIIHLRRIAQAASPACVALVASVVSVACLASSASAVCLDVTMPAPHAPRVSAEPPAELLTVAERTGFTQTARHADVVALLDRLAAASPLARCASMGTSSEGRDLPMLIMSDPPVSSALEARRAAAAGKIIVLAIGNIHAGEIDGKEALPILARDLLLAGASDPAAGDLLKRLVVVFVPIYNPDGNERFGNNRPTQNGPALTGVRENAHQRDLNRDFIKLEEPETRALVRAFNEWDPHVFVDCHITNGSLHRYIVTYAGPKGPATDPGLERFSRERMLPQVGAMFAARTGWNANWYGSFGSAFSEEPTDRTRWGTYPAEARFGTTYVGLRNRPSVLVETYTYAPFADRVQATRAFVRAILDWSAASADQLRAVCAAADAARPGTLAMRTRATAWPGTVPILGYEERLEGGRPVSTGVEKTYDCELWDKFVSTLDAPLPGPRGGYLLWSSDAAKAGALDAIVSTLRAHGIVVRDVMPPPGKDSLSLDATAFSVTNIEQAGRPFQGHVIAKVDARAQERRVKITAAVAPPGGSTRAPAWFVPLDQPLGRLAAYMLEPTCEDGLAAWNFYDPWLAPGTTLPIMHVAMDPSPPPAR